MTRTLTGSMTTGVAAETTFLARLWQITLANGSVYSFTDCPEAIVYDGTTFSADPGMSVSAIQSNATSGTQNASVQINLKTSVITEADIRAGLLDNAGFSLWIVDWSHPNTTYGRITLFVGSVADIDFNDKQLATLQLRGLVQGANQKSGGYYSKNCRARFTDSKCGIDPTTVRVAFTVTAVSGLTITAVAFSGLTNNRFALGRVDWLTGSNAGTSTDIASNDGTAGTVTLQLPAGKVPIVGDTGYILPGCDKSISTCHTKWNNVANFRGEPYAPPADLNPLTTWRDPNAVAPTSAPSGSGTGSVGIGGA